MEGPQSNLASPGLSFFLGHEAKIPAIFRAIGVVPIVGGIPSGIFEGVKALQERTEHDTHQTALRIFRAITVMIPFVGSLWTVADMVYDLYTRKIQNRQQQQSHAMEAAVSEVVEAAVSESNVFTRILEFRKKLSTSNDEGSVYPLLKELEDTIRTASALAPAFEEKTVSSIAGFFETIFRKKNFINRLDAQSRILFLATFDLFLQYLNVVDQGKIRQYLLFIQMHEKILALKEACTHRPILTDFIKENFIPTLTEIFRGFPINEEIDGDLLAELNPLFSNQTIVDILGSKQRQAFALAEENFHRLLAEWNKTLDQSTKAKKAPPTIVPAAQPTASAVAATATANRKKPTPTTLLTKAEQPLQTATSSSTSLPPSSTPSAPAHATTSKIPKPTPPPIKSPPPAKLYLPPIEAAPPIKSTLPPPPTKPAPPPPLTTPTAAAHATTNVLKNTAHEPSPTSGEKKSSTASTTVPKPQGDLILDNFLQTVRSQEPLATGNSATPESDEQLITLLDEGFFQFLRGLMDTTAYERRTKREFEKDPLFKKNLRRIESFFDEMVIRPSLINGLDTPLKNRYNSLYQRWLRDFGTVAPSTLVRPSQTTTTTTTKAS